MLARLVKIDYIKPNSGFNGGNLITLDIICAVLCWSNET